MLLGRLEKVDLRTQWLGEAAHFTPWLAKEENIGLLAEALGLELEVQGQEERVGPFRADILCKDLISNRHVLIENQLERTDHIHLGQILTYAAGLDAVTIIWVARNFSEEHRAALDWLNRITVDDIHFFGLEIELYKIGDSAAAPMFRIISKPNDWSKTIRKAAETGQLSPTKLLQQEYWQALKTTMENAKSFVRNQKPLPQHWTNFSLGKSNFNMSAFANTRNKSIGVVMQFFGESAKINFAKIKEQEFDAQTAISSDLLWRELPDAKESQVMITFSADPTDKKDWPRQHQILKENLEKFHKFFSSRIKML